MQDPVQQPGASHWQPDEIARLRRDTPGSLERLHLNNAGSALPPRSVVTRVIEHLELEARIGGYEAASARAREIRAAYEIVGELVGVPAEQIAFVENATAGYAQALSCIPFERGDVILTSQEDYISNQIMFLSLVRRVGVRVQRVGCLAEGGIDLDDLRRRLKIDRPRLLAISHVPTNSGLVQPVEAAGVLAREQDVLYLVDACQSVGQLPVDLECIRADFLTTTSRKFLRGPRGSGFMAVSARVLQRGLEPLFLDMQGASWVAADRYEVKPTAARFENWEFAYALLLGTAEAARYALDVGIERMATRTAMLAEQLREGLAERGYRLLDRGVTRCGIVTVEVPGVDRDALMAELEHKRLNASLSLLEYGRIDFGEKGVEWALRLSPHYYNTVEEIEAAVEILTTAQTVLNA